MYNHDRILIIVSNDYSGYSVMSPLSSAINDVSLIYTYFKKRKRFNEDQIYVYGKMNLNGKLVSWRKRYNKDISPEVIEGKQLYFYYSGHGYPGGKINVSSNLAKILSFPDYSILDCCYSHQFNISRNLIGSTREGNSLATSNNVVSKFTFEIVKILISEDLTFESFKQWIDDRGYYLRIGAVGDGDEGDLELDSFTRDILQK